VDGWSRVTGHAGAAPPHLPACYPIYRSFPGIKGIEQKWPYPGSGRVSGHVVHMSNRRLGTRQGDAIADRPSDMGYPQARCRPRLEDRPTSRVVGTSDVCSNAAVNSDLSCFLYRGTLRWLYLNCQADHHHHHHQVRVASKGRRVVAPPCPRSTARLQRSPIGRVELFCSWSSHLFHGRPRAVRRSVE